MLNSLSMTHLLLLLLRIKMKVLIFLTMTFSQSLHGLIIRKCFFSSDPSKPAQELLFSRKKRIQVHPAIIVSTMFRLKECLIKNI